MHKWRRRRSISPASSAEVAQGPRTGTRDGYNPAEGFFNALRLIRAQIERVISELSRAAVKEQALRRHAGERLRSSQLQMQMRRPASACLRGGASVCSKWSAAKWWVCFLPNVNMGIDHDIQSRFKVQMRWKWIFQHAKPSCCVPVQLSHVASLQEDVYFHCNSCVCRCYRLTKAINRRNAAQTNLVCGSRQICT